MQGAPGARRVPLDSVADVWRAGLASGRGGSRPRLMCRIRQLDLSRSRGHKTRCDAASHILAGLLPKIAIERIHPARKLRAIVAWPKWLNNE